MSGVGVEWEGGPRGRRHMYTYCGFTLLYCRNEQNIRKQLYANKMFFKKEEKKSMSSVLKLSFSSIIISVSYEFLLKNSLTFIFSLLLICLQLLKFLESLNTILATGRVVWFLCWLILMLILTSLISKTSSLVSIKIWLESPCALDLRLVHIAEVHHPGSWDLFPTFPSKTQLYFHCFCNFPRAPATPWVT